MVAFIVFLLVLTVISITLGIIIMSDLKENIYGFSGSFPVYIHLLTFLFWFISIPISFYLNRKKILHYFTEPLNSQE